MNSRYRILIQGKNPRYFLSLLIREHIKIYKKEESSLGMVVHVDNDGYQKIQDIKTSYSITVLNRFGLAKIQYLFHKYFVFLLSLFLFFGVLFFLSHLIFDIEVIHSNHEIRSIIYEDLKELGIEKFHFKVAYQEKEEIVERILEKETERIEWLEIEEVGTKYIVRVEERKKNKDSKSCQPRSIVAKKDAMILEIHAEAGEVKKKRLDYVKKGDVIISGLIYNKEEIVSKRCARGQVFGEVWYQVSLEIPTHYHEEKVTGKKKRKLEIQFLNHTYHFFSHYDTYQKKSVSILASRLLPIKFLYSTYLETEVIDEEYTIDNVDDKAYLLAEEKIRQQLSKDDEVISKKILKKYEKNSKIIVEVFFRVKEDITDTISIKDIDIEKENKKKEE